MCRLWFRRKSSAQRTKRLFIRAVGQQARLEDVRRVCGRALAGYVEEAAADGGDFLEEAVHLWWYACQCRVSSTQTRTASKSACKSVRTPHSGISAMTPSSAGSSGDMGVDCAAACAPSTSSVAAIHPVTLGLIAGRRGGDHGSEGATTWGSCVCGFLPRKSSGSLPSVYIYKR